MEKKYEVSILLTRRKKNFFRSLSVDILAWSLIIPSALCIFLLIIRPQVLGVYWSFFDMKGFEVEDFVGWDNYIRVLKSTAFMSTFINTWKYVFWSLVIGLFIPLITAVVLNEMLHCRNSLRVLVYLPCIMPGVAVSLLWTMMYSPEASGLLNSVLTKFGMEPYVWLQDSRFTIL